MERGALPSDLDDSAPASLPLPYLGEEQESPSEQR